jgi:hypothetical protein
LRKVEILEPAALKPLEALLVDLDALAPGAMDRASVGELQGMAATLCSGRSGDRSTLSSGAPGGHRREPSSDVRRVAGREMFAEEGGVAARHFSTKSVVFSFKAAPIQILTPTAP